MTYWMKLKNYANKMYRNDNFIICIVNSATTWLMCTNAMDLGFARDVSTVSPVLFCEIVLVVKTASCV